MQNWIYEMYEHEILYFQKQGDTLLQNIKQLETMINKNRQQKLQINENDFYMLNEMTKNMLRIITLVDCYRYLQLINEPLTEENQIWCYNLINNYYLYLLRCFNTKLNAVDFFIDQ